MFIGHYAVALASKRIAPKVSLGTLFVSAQFVDLLWPVFLLLGLENVRIDPGNTAVTPLDFYNYPFSHSMLAAFFWAAILGVGHFLVKRNKMSSLVIGFCVFSHWILDFITHRADLPLAIGTDRYFGLGLWNSLVGTIIVELTFYVGGIFWYVKSTKPADRIGNYGFWALVLVLFFIYLANLFGPPPPNEFAIATAGNASWLFVIWAYWIDHHRRENK